MSIYSPPSVTFEAVTDFGITGLTGTITVLIMDNVGNTVYGPSVAGIAEYPLASGIYQVTLTAPANEGQYSVVWDDGAGHVAVDDLLITSDAPIQVIGSPGSALGPISGWLIGADVADCCDVEASSDGTLFDQVAQVAQGLLFELSGRIFPGIGRRTVRPCNTNCSCNWQVLSRGHIVWNDAWSAWGGSGSWWCDDNPCGCRPLSRVWLAGYPVQSILEVKVDGVVVDPATYRLDEHTYLTRVRDPADPDTVLRWPGCQHLDLDDAQEGTFSVTYLYGQNPPEAGISAAAQLACELYKECDNQPCQLPRGVTRVTRQGISIEKAAFTAWGFQAGGGRSVLRGWRTGLPLVDAFLNSWNPAGLVRRPTFWAPSMTKRYAQEVG